MIKIHLDGKELVAEPTRIEVENGEKWLHFRVKVPMTAEKPVAEKPPESHELKRAFGRGITLQGRTSMLPLEVSESVLDGSPTRRENLQRIAEALPLVIARIASQKAGLEALRPVQKLSVIPATGAPQAGLSGGTLVLRLDLDGALPADLPKILGDVILKSL